MNKEENTVVVGGAEHVDGDHYDEQQRMNNCEKPASKRRRRQRIDGQRAHDQEVSSDQFQCNRQFLQAYTKTAVPDGELCSELSVRDSSCYLAKVHRSKCGEEATEA